MDICYNFIEHRVTGVTVFYFGTERHGFLKKARLGLCDGCRFYLL